MILSLQYLRGVAALMVVWFHAGSQLERMGLPHLPLHAAGEYGVDVFFVISGVVMWVTTVGRRMSPGDFMRRRLERIAPLYWLITAVVATVALLAPSLLHSTTFDAPHLAASLLFYPWPNPVDGGRTPVLVPGWTLNYEMFFYLLFALTLLAPRGWRPLALAALLAGAVAAGIGAPPASLRAFYGDPMILEFGAGVAIGALMLRRAAPPAALGWAAAAASLPLALLLSTGHDAPRALYAGLPAALAVGGLALAERRRPLPVWPLWLRIGDASYSIYLTHPLTLALVSTLWRAAGLRQPPLYYACAVAAALAVGLACHALIERPMARWLAARRPARPAGAPAAQG